MSDGYMIENAARKIIVRLYRNDNLDKATLAGLRGAETITSPRAQVAWPLIMKYLPPNFLGKTDKPSPGEVAVYAAIRFYAIFQQGKDDFACGNVDQNSGVSLFTALADLRSNAELKTALDNRVRSLLITTDVTSVINSLTHLIKILKGKDRSKKIDYPLLAKNLYKFQMNSYLAEEVCFSWGKQYFKVANSNKEIEGE